MDAFGKAGKEDICVVSRNLLPVHQRCLVQSQDPSPLQPSTTNCFLRGNWWGRAGQRVREGAGSLSQNSQGVELKRWRKARDDSDRGVQKLRPRFASTPSVCVWFCLCCCGRRSLSPRTRSTLKSLASCFPACSVFVILPHTSPHVIKLHALGLSQILASYSSSCTNPTPSLRKEKML